MCHALKKQQQQQQQQKTNKNIFFDVDIVDSLGYAS